MNRVPTISLLVFLVWVTSPAPLGLANPVLSINSYWTNSLGMVFVPIPKTQVQFCIWETRVKDFTAFARATGNEPGEQALSASSGLSRWNWHNPGFQQEPTHPVVQVSWEEAEAFCNWLTEHERKAGDIRSDQFYRLPTDLEWSRAVGESRYPWSEMLPPAALSNALAAGESSVRLDDRRYFPPSHGAGNYAGGEVAGVSATPEMRSLKQYTDAYARTAPAGSFKPNRYGIYDLGGNVWEWCADWFRKDLNSEELEQKLPYSNVDLGGTVFKVLRGASWLDSHPAVLRSDCRFFEFPDHHSDTIGFRIVLTGPPH